MICPKCGKLNKDSSKFCFGCGAKLTMPMVVENGSPSIDPEDEKTMLMHDIENEKTELLYESDEFENEETVILDDSEVNTEPEAIITLEDFEDEKTVILDELNKGNKDILSKETVPDFKYKNRVPVYKEEKNYDTAYIDHLRALKQLWDDGIITEEEFVKKKRQILGL